MASPYDPPSPPPQGLPTLPVAPHKIAEVSPEFNTTIVEMENGREQRFSNQEIPVTEFKVKYTLLNQVETEKLMEFFIARKGAWGTWALYNHHDGSWYTVRFKDDEISPKYTRKKFASLEFEVKTCL